MSKLTGVRRHSPCKEKKAQYFDEVVRLYFEEGLSGVEISRIIPIHNSNVYRWLDEYEMRQNRIEASMKKHERVSDKKNPVRLTGIPAPETRAKQERALEREDSPERGESVEVLRLQDRIRDLEKQLRDKDKALRETRLKADLYNEIINVAEKRYNVPIRKKAGAKR